MTVEVWWARIDQARDEFAADLDEAEQGRLAAYRRDGDKARFLLGCTMVRRLLAARFSLPAAKVRLDRRCPDCGKPHGKVRADGIELSVTHSGELVGVAVGAHPVGLDVEKVDQSVDIDGVGRLCLASEERRELARYNGIARAKAFAQVWTRKEAVVKANGIGIRTDLRTVVVNPPYQPPEVREWVQQTGPTRLIDLEVGAHYAAALAVLRAEPPVVQVNDATQLLI